MVLRAMLSAILANNFLLSKETLSSVIILLKRGLARVTCSFTGLWEIEKARRASCGPGVKTTDYCQCLPLPLPGFTLVLVVVVSLTTSTELSVKVVPVMVTF